jgi:glycosyltransferase involved in cell wall biosynthesis
MSQRRPRVVGVLVGDIIREPGARTKYGLLFEALARRISVAGVHDATLGGVERLLNALRVAHPNRQVWRERFYQNVPAFGHRSRRAAAYLRSMRHQAEVVLQIGVLFDAGWEVGGLPNVIYTDYTACLAARRPAAGRSPFSPRHREQWIALEGRTLRRAAHVYTRSQFVRAAIMADYGLAPERVTAIGGGVNIAPLPEPGLRTGSSAPSALFIGKDFYRKGGDLVLLAFARARTHLPRARLTMVTEGPIPPDLPLEGVELVRPTWDRMAIVGHYRRADVFVLPSRLETWGDVLLEAMAFGLPCLGVRGEAMAEIISDEETGIIVPPDDVDALAAALVRLLGDEGLRLRLGRAARMKVGTAYTWERVVDRMVPGLEAAARISKMGNTGARLSLASTSSANDGAT